MTYQGMVEYLDANPDVDPLSVADHTVNVLLNGIGASTPPAHTALLTAERSA